MDVMSLVYVFFLLVRGERTPKFLNVSFGWAKNDKMFVLLSLSSERNKSLNQFPRVPENL